MSFESRSSEAFETLLARTGGFVVLAGFLALLGIRSIKRGAPPVPEMAIEEAKKTRAAIEEARH